ncbi:hypothetical protein PR048_000696, partial [Dryococelus australis]
MKLNSKVHFMIRRYTLQNSWTFICLKLFLACRAIAFFGATWGVELSPIRALWPYFNLAKHAKGGQATAMSQRSRDAGRHNPSRSAKQKVKEEKERRDQIVMSKTRKMTEYLNVPGDNYNTKKTEAENIETSTTSYTKGMVRIEENIETPTTPTTSVAKGKIQQPAFSGCEMTVSVDKGKREQSEFSECEATTSNAESEIQQPASSECEAATSIAKDKIQQPEFSESEITTSEAKDKLSTEMNTYSNGLGKWPNNLNDRDSDYWLNKGNADFQHANSDFYAS